MPDAMPGEGPDLEEEKNNLVVQNAKNNKILKDIEDGRLLHVHLHVTSSFEQYQHLDSFVS